MSATSYWNPKILMFKPTFKENQGNRLAFKTLKELHVASTSSGGRILDGRSSYHFSFDHAIKTTLLV